MHITVYLGASRGNDPALERAVRELGRWIGTSGNALVYGGSKTGLMGCLARSVLEAGGQVTGVEPQFFMDAGYQYDGLTRLIVTEDMARRRRRSIAGFSSRSPKPPKSAPNWRTRLSPASSCRSS